MNISDISAIVIGAANPLGEEVLRAIMRGEGRVLLSDESTEALGTIATHCAPLGEPSRVPKHLPLPPILNGLIGPYFGRALELMDGRLTHLFVLGNQPMPQRQLLALTFKDVVGPPARVIIGGTGIHVDTGDFAMRMMKGSVGMYCGMSARRALALADVRGQGRHVLDLAIRDRGAMVEFEPYPH